MPASSLCADLIRVHQENTGLYVTISYNTHTPELQHEGFEVGTHAICKSIEKVHTNKINGSKLKCELQMQCSRRTKLNIAFTRTHRRK